MSNPLALSLVYLLQSGYTHNDLKNLFYTHESIYTPEGVWSDILGGTVSGDISDERKAKILEKSKKVDTEGISRLILEKEISIITIHDDSYPQRLRNIGHAPYFLFVRGILRGDMPLIGIVGSRKSTSYAEKILKKLVPDILTAGVGTISGGATGVDSFAHHTTLDHDGYTIAVFGTGIDRCYPAGNKTLFENILKQGGALISHFPLGTGPEMYNFPMRNELVAALSSGVLIPEAALSSGTLITAQLALEHGRDVFAVPGDIDRATSEGTNMLIATGQAKCVRCAGDILEEYFDIESIGTGMTPIIKVAPVFIDEKEKLIYESIHEGYNTIDALLDHTGYEMTDILTTIAMLELGGHVQMTEMGKYEIL